MTSYDMAARWPFGHLWKRPQGDTIKVVAYGLNQLLIEHPGAADPQWVPVATADEWQPA